MARVDIRAGAAEPAAAGGEPQPDLRVTVTGAKRGNATLEDPPWRSDFAEPAAGEFSTAFFRQDAVEVARNLLGARLVSTLGDRTVSVVLVETEAYRGPDDPASHAAVRAGKTDRNAAMFGAPGHAYIYLIYGMHWCLNVVTGEEEVPQAVLLRGAELLDGGRMVEKRRGRARGSESSPGLLAGPGCLSQGLGVTGQLYGHDLRVSPLRLVPGWSVPEGLTRATGRVGVRDASDRPWRFVVKGSHGVTRSRSTEAPPLR